MGKGCNVTIFMTLAIRPQDLGAGETGRQAPVAAQQGVCRPQGREGQQSVARSQVQEELGAQGGQRRMFSGKRKAK